MGAKQSAQTGGTRLVSPPSGQFESASASAVIDNDSNHNALLEPPGARPRTRSMDSVPQSSSGVENGHPVGISGSQAPGLALPIHVPNTHPPIHVPPTTLQPNSSGQLASEDGAYGNATNASSDAPTPDRISLPVHGRVFHAQSLPVHLLSLPGTVGWLVVGWW